MASTPHSQLVSIGDVQVMKGGETRRYRCRRRHGGAGSRCEGSRSIDVYGVLAGCWRAAGGLPPARTHACTRGSGSRGVSSDAPSAHHLSRAIPSFCRFGDFGGLLGGKQATRACTGQFSLSTKLRTDENQSTSADDSANARFADATS